MRNMIISDLLKDMKIDPKSLTEEEVKTLQKWQSEETTRPRTTAEIYEHIRTMILAVEEELAKNEHSEKRDTYLKARLQNYLVLKNFIEYPEKAREYIEKQLQNLK